jgi:hypothetical protein
VGGGIGCSVCALWVMAVVWYLNDSDHEALEHFATTHRDEMEEERTINH